MGCLDSDVLGGYLPSAHGDIHIVVGPSGDDRMYVSYSGTLEALLAAGAIDAAMAADSAAEGQRDAHLRPYRREELGEGQCRFTRWFGNLKQVVDLPGLGGEQPLNVDRLKNPASRLRLVVNRP